MLRAIINLIFIVILPVLHWDEQGLILDVREIKWYA